MFYEYGADYLTLSFIETMFMCDNALLRDNQLHSLLQLGPCNRMLLQGQVSFVWLLSIRVCVCVIHTAPTEWKTNWETLEKAMVNICNSVALSHSHIALFRDLPHLTTKTLSGLSNHSQRFLL